jgi:CheY-like chemotaxis protein
VQQGPSAAIAGGATPRWPRAFRRAPDGVAGAEPVRRAGPPALSAAVILGLGREAGPPEARRLRVLVADADPARRDRQRLLLEAAGEACLAARLWDEALGVLAREPVDAAIVALDPAPAGGLAAAAALRGWPPPVAALPLLALHAGHTRIVEETWRKAGFDALLLWPQEAEGLAARVREAVVRLTPPPPLDPARRAALRAAMDPAALAAHDQAALARAHGLVLAIDSAAEEAAAREAALALAAVCEALGAAPAAAAARAVAEAAGRPRASDALLNALSAAAGAIRLAGRAARVAR